MFLCTVVLSCPDEQMCLKTVLKRCSLLSVLESHSGQTKEKDCKEMGSLALSVSHTGKSDQQV